jgi:hypothetical protein
MSIAIYMVFGKPRLLKFIAMISVDLLQIIPNMANQEFSIKLIFQMPSKI